MLLSKCNFCGSQDVILTSEAWYIGERSHYRHEIAGYYYYVSCNNCKAQGPEFKDDKITAANYWNNNFRTLD